jgi:hypothetical protein
MPTFPTYDGELPQCLNPLNPRHYGLVLYWVFFRPTALKCYLYQASPDLYQSEPSSQKIITCLREPAYRLFFWISILFITIFIISNYFINHFFGLFLGTLFICILGEIFSIQPIISVLSLLGFLVVLVVVLAFKNTSDLLIFYGFVFMINIFFDTSISMLSIMKFMIYPLQILFALIESRFKLDSYPMEWDESGILALPYSRQHLSSLLVRLPEKGIRKISDNVLNHQYLSVIHDCVWNYLLQSKSPIKEIYYLLTVESLERYAKAPTVDYQWQFGISSREVLFAQMVGIPLNFMGRVRINKRLFTYSDPPAALLDLVALIYRYMRLESNCFEASINRDIPDERIRSMSRSTFTKVHDFRETINFEVHLDPSLDIYPYGSEVRQSFNTIFQYSNIETPEEIATASTYLTWLNPTDTFLRPTVINAIQTLANLSQEVHRSNFVSSAVTKRNAILIANDQLEQLKTYVTDQIHPNYPEQKLLLRIIDQWQTIITREGGQLGRETLEKPIENPYVVGPPVTGSLFVGREDILTKLEELWTKPGQLESVVIYGHRRMGKTSILRNLPGRFANNTKIINFNIQTQGNVRSTTELIFNLAQAIYDDLPPHLQTATPEPQITDFDRPEQSFKRFLKKLEPHRQNDRFIIAIDEFELIEDGIKNGHFEPSLIGHWRGILTDFHWIIFAFAGLHTLQEMTQDYWNPLFGNVRKIPVSFLTPTAAHRLITQPSLDFAIDYNPEAIKLIYNLTGGQPYLIQLICQNLVSNFNRQRFEENREIEPLFTETEVTAIVTNPDFFRDGTAYFRAIWEQAQETHAETQLAILKQLSISRATETELNNLIKPSFIPEALNLLLTHDVIQLNSENQYQYRVELMRQWVQLRDSNIRIDNPGNL